MCSDFVHFSRVCVPRPLIHNCIHERKQIERMNDNSRYVVCTIGASDDEQCETSSSMRMFAGNLPESQPAACVGPAQCSAI